jgi:amino acid adenylation domain-containing protein
LDIAYGYRRENFTAEQVERLAGHLDHLLQQMIAAPEACLGRFSLLTPDEAARLDTVNATDEPYEAVPNVLALIDRQVRATPQAVALAFGEAQLTYAAMEARANRLAHWLAGQGVGPEAIVGVAMERALELPLVLLAILKAGGAYLPLEPDLPPARLAGMLADSGARLVLTQRHLKDALPPETAVLCVAIEDLALDGLPTSPPEAALHPESLAYVIYTSGSTGRPKGVGNRHAGLLNRLQWMQAAYGLEASDSVLQKTPFGFDVSVWEFFWPLMVGARLVVAAPGAHRDPAALRQVITEQGVTTLHFVPSMLAAFAGELDRCPGLKRILCSGEALPHALQQAVLQASPAELHNLYGPTEAAIDVTAWACRSEPQATTVPIGRAIANTQIHVLDAALNQVPQGVPGELYIAGVNLARGYLGRAGLTAERFVANPYGPPGSRMYRSGDLVRRRADGALEYLGRLDHQVKLRGQRLELGEIEAALRACAAVGEAVVVLRDGRLVGYVTPNGDTPPDEAAIRAALAERLPGYMVPAKLVVLDALPLSPNGKLDRKTLPAPGWAGTQADAEPPRGPVEEALAEVWCEVLNLQAVARTDNFFDIGGHSLAAMKVRAVLLRRYEVAPSVRDFFDRPRLTDLADCLPETLTQGHQEKQDRLSAMDQWMSEIEA